ncbi:MFS transporter [Streptomyces sp. NPDC007088]|uniref:MFS transporter n=1 Tax=Streptomyces sp. NPDC007088 TaxID=3364773 RepID=UPI0036D00747
MTTRRTQPPAQPQPQQRERGDQEGRGQPGPEPGRLPWAALIALGSAAFLAILTEALPAGMLPEMSRDLSVGQSAMGQSLTVYALATALPAIPLVALTARWPRRRLVVGAVALVSAGNLVSAVSPAYALTLVFRGVSGVAAGLVWALLVGYARRLAPPRLRGRAIAVTMTGVPLALSLGVPLGTLLGGALGWRPTFALVAVLGAALGGWILVSVPDAPGRRGANREPVLRALARPGVKAVLFVVAAYVLAHNILYTYIAAFLDAHGMKGSVDLILLVFGLASLVSVVVTGAQVDRRPRTLTLASTVLFATGAAILAAPAGYGALVYVATILWGLGWGAVSTLLQTAVTDAGGEGAQPLLVTVWNGFMGVGGAVGGLLLSRFGPLSFPWSVLALLAPALLVVVLARGHAFPARRPAAADSSP